MDCYLPRPYQTPHYISIPVEHLTGPNNKGTLMSWLFYNTSQVPPTQHINRKLIGNPHYHPTLSQDQPVITSILYILIFIYFIFYYIFYIFYIYIFYISYILNNYILFIYLMYFYLCIYLLIILD